MNDLDRLIDEALRTPFSGWDFRWLAGRIEETRPPWNYGSELSQALARADAALDIDTGGGEVLARHRAGTGTIVATEGYPPNIDVAAATLRPFGVSVVGTGSAPDNIDQPGTTPDESGTNLPFRDETFDLVVDRHSSYWPTEVRRVLRPGGTFLTQQFGVGGDDVLRMFERPVSGGPDFDLAFAVAQLQDAGMDVIRAEEATTPIAFLDVGAFVYFMRAVPWVLPDLDVVEDRGGLEAVDATVGRAGAFELPGEHMLIVASRSSPGGAR
jgi:SAM-dependent methyltransferase